jgi:hypothetical protein
MRFLYLHQEGNDDIMRLSAKKLKPPLPPLTTTTTKTTTARSISQKFIQKIIVLYVRHYVGCF